MAKPIEFVLKDLEGGRAHRDLSDQLAEVVAAVIEHRKIGELTLKLKIAPNGENNVFVDTAISSKIPTKARSRTLFYVSTGGDLIRDNPDAPPLPLTVVPQGENKTLATVPDDTKRFAG
jgi:hypothetical protein